MHCAEQFLELKICISPQFRAIDPPNPAGGFIQQNENVRFATAACMQKYGNVRFATVACAKCMRYGGRGGGPYHGGGGGNTGHGTIYIYICIIFFVHVIVILMLSWPLSEIVPFLKHFGLPESHGQGEKRQKQTCCKSKAETGRCR